MLMLNVNKGEVQFLHFMWSNNTFKKIKCNVL
jgi:hypothetical protein